jgi:HD-GYP domain-containing protein (c-di-GMP phosphodiesterase class II)
VTTDRPYRQAARADDPLDEIRRCAGTQFDRAVVDAFATELAHRTTHRPVAEDARTPQPAGAA